MADTHDKKTRSYNMSQIRSKNTKPEILVRKFLFSRGFRYKLYDKDLYGKPDIVLPKYNLVIFIHGCFWHGHKHCRYFKIPKTRTEWWTEKIGNNQARDKNALIRLKRIGWKVAVIWECKLKKDKIENTLEKLLLNLTID